MSSPDAPASLLVLEAAEAFRRELPQLLEERPGQWVGYHGPERIGFAPTKDQMARECLERGLKREAFFVGCIEPETGELFWGPGPLDDLMDSRG